MKLRHHLEYAAVQGVARLVRLLPRRLATACGTALGLTFYVFDGSHRRLALANLTAAFPSRSPRERRSIVRSVFGHFGRALVDLLTFSSLTPNRMHELVDVEGLERVRQLYAQGKGAIFVTGHFGFWEINGIAHGLEIAPIGVLARALDNPKLNDMLEHMRACTGNTVIYRRGAVRRILRALASNQGVAILIDQHIQQADAVSVEFFNRPAATTSAVAALALRSGAPAIPCFTLPAPGGRYKIVYEHPITPPSPDDPDPLRTFTQRCTDVLEMYVRRYPELWLWMHRRWREGEGSNDKVRGMFPPASGGDSSNGGREE